MKNHDLSFDKVVLSYPELLDTAKNDAIALEIAANTLEALEGMKTRQDVEFISRPEVKESN